MSCVKVIVALLAADAPLLALVPVEKIMAGVIPQGTSLPAVSVTEVSTVEISHIDAQAPYTLVDARVQVTVVAASYPAQKALLAAVRKACNYKRGTLVGVPVVSVRRGSNGPDFNDPETDFYLQSVDFHVIYHEAN